MKYLAFILGTLSLASPIWAAIAYVNTANNSADAGATTIATAATSLTAGNLIVCAVVWTGVGSITGFANTAGDTFAQASGAKYTSPNSDSVDIWYAMNSLGSAINKSTATFSVSQTFRRIICNQYSGAATSSAIDVSTNQFVAAGTSISATLITTAASDVIVAAVGSSVAQTYTQGSGFTLESTIQGTDTQSEDEITTTAGSYAVAMSGLNSGRFFMTAASFKPAATTSIVCPAVMGSGIVCGGSF